MFFFFKQKTAYEMRISDWSSDVCSSDLRQPANRIAARVGRGVGVEEIGGDAPQPARAGDRRDVAGIPAVRRRVVGAQKGAARLGDAQQAGDGHRPARIAGGACRGITLVRWYEESGRAWCREHGGRPGTARWVQI